MHKHIPKLHLVFSTIPKRPLVPGASWGVQVFVPTLNTPLAQRVGHPWQWRGESFPESLLLFIDVWLPLCVFSRPVQQPHVHQQCPVQSVQCAESTHFLSSRLWNRQIPEQPTVEITLNPNKVLFHYHRPCAPLWKGHPPPPLPQGYPAVVLKGPNLLYCRIIGIGVLILNLLHNDYKKMSSVIVRW